MNAPFLLPTAVRHPSTMTTSRITSTPSFIYRHYTSPAYRFETVSFSANSAKRHFPCSMFLKKNMKRKICYYMHKANKGRRTSDEASSKCYIHCHKHYFCNRQLPFRCTLQRNRGVGPRCYFPAFCCLFYKIHSK